MLRAIFNNASTMMLFYIRAHSGPNPSTSSQRRGQNGYDGHKAATNGIGIPAVDFQMCRRSANSPNKCIDNDKPIE